MKKNNYKCFLTRIYLYLGQRVIFELILYIKQKNYFVTTTNVVKNTLYLMGAPHNATPLANILAVQTMVGAEERRDIAYVHHALTTVINV